MYLINRMPSKSNPTCSPLEKLFGRTPNYKRLKVFGCLCYPWLRPYAPLKIHPKSTPCVFLGYSSAKSAYKCFDTKNQRLYFSRHVRFVENHFPMQVSSLCSSQTASQTTRDQLSDTSTPPGQFHNIIPHRRTLPLQTSSATSPTHTPNMPPPESPSHQNPSSPATSLTSSSLSVTRDLSAVADEFIESSPPPSKSTILWKPNPKYFNSSFVNYTTTHPIPPTLEPTCVSQALKDPNWRHAMSSECDALIRNGTWDLVPRTNQNVIASKWVFRIKRNADGSVQKYKARVVAKGF